jgi:integrase
MWLAGLRPSEAVALKKSHFHLSAKGSYIQVEQACVTVGKEFGDDIKVGRKIVRTSTVLKQLKARGEGEVRKVPINKELKKQITPYLKKFKDEEYVFPLWDFSRQFVVDQHGKKVMKRNGTGPLWTIQKTVDLNRPMLTDTIHHYIQKTSLNGVKPYDLRHTNASILIYSGLNIVEIASRLGHSVQVCQSVYLHLIEDKKPFDTSREDGFLNG